MAKPLCSVFASLDFLPVFYRGAIFHLPFRIIIFNIFTNVTHFTNSVKSLPRSKNFKQNFVPDFLSFPYRISHMLSDKKDFPEEKSKCAGILRKTIPGKGRSANEIMFVRCTSSRGSRRDRLFSASSFFLLQTSESVRGTPGTKLISCAVEAAFSCSDGNAGLF